MKLFNLGMFLLLLSFFRTAMAAPEVPLFSGNGEEHWYYIVFSAGDAALEDQGDKNSAVTRIAKFGKESQLWKFEGDRNEFRIVSKMGNVLMFNEYIKASKDPSQAAMFRLVASEHPSYADSWEIEYPAKGDEWNRWNQWGNTGPGVRIGLYTKGETNNALRFIKEADLPKVPEFTKIKEFAVSSDNTFRPEERHTLWYLRPATGEDVSDPWMEYALPIGNGEFGAMTFGGVAQDRLQFNHKSLWTGTSTSRGSYQNFGDLYIEDISSVFGTLANEGPKDYVRWLDMPTAVSGARYRSPDGSVEFTRQYIASYPDRCVAVRLAADKPGNISVRIRLFNGIKQGMLAPAYSSDGSIEFKGCLDLVSFRAVAKACPKGGQMTATDEYLEIKNADELLLILCGDTDFDPHSPSYIGNTENRLAMVEANAVKAAAKGWKQLLADHVVDFNSYFGRSDFSISAAENDRDIESIVRNYNNRRALRTEPCNLMLEELYYAFGRYLLISSSRGIDSPANLQGIWNHSSSPAWQSDIHSNINVQMNYWPAESTNLSEMHLPFLNYLHSMATGHREWTDYALKSGQTKGWTCFTQNNIFGHSDFAENYVIANAWYCSHLWQHYAYTLDRDFLRLKALPVMISCADFWMERLVEDTDGLLVAPKEWSPEHGPDAEDGTAHAQQIVRELFSNTLDAIEVLGEESGVCSDYKEILKEKLSRLDKGLATEPYLGETSEGINPGDLLLREWKSSPYTVGEAAHRHQSHLMAMYPFGDITPESEWFEPAVNSLRLRGNQSTGWSLAWRIALWARALDGEYAHTIIKNALRHSTSYGQSNGAGGVYFNLLDSHAPFQIDGNFGFTAGVTEMLMQSHGGVIRLLPALSPYWTEGKVVGLKARGNFEVSQEWSEGRLVKALVKSLSGGECRLKYKGIENASIIDGDGLKVEFAADGDMAVFPTVPGGEYTLLMNSGSGVSSCVADGLAIRIAGEYAFVDAPGVEIRAYDVAGRCLAVSVDSKLRLAGLLKGVVVVKASANGNSTVRKIVL